MKARPIDKSSRWREKIRNQLIHELGGRCICCGTTENLQLDHIEPESRTWDASKISPYARLLFYSIDIARGNVQVLCQVCNQQKEYNLRLQLTLDLCEHPRQPNML